VVDVILQVESGERIMSLLDRGEIAVGIVIPPDFEQRLQESRQPDGRRAARLLVDGSDPIVLAAARGLTGMQLRQDTTHRETVAPPLFEVRNSITPSAAIWRC